MFRIIGILILVVIVSLSLVTVFAKSEKSNSGNGQENQGNNRPAEAVDISRGNPHTALNPQATCDPNANWRNHGDYVSCVARLHQGGAVVSEAAKSDVGKNSTSSGKTKHATSSASPSASGSASPTASASATIASNLGQQVSDLVQSIRLLLQQLRHLFNF